MEISAEDSAPQRRNDHYLPRIALIATVRNEEKYIEAALDSVLAQEYPSTFQVILSVGPSKDNTYGLVREYALRDPRIVILENPSGLIPNGLNIALAACPSESEVVVRFDGHTRLPRGYVSTMVETLIRTGAQNVGGLMKPVGKSNIEQAVARGMSHPLGIGPASFHVGGVEGPNETAYLGTFDLEAIKDAGGYDEHFQRAEDWELNLRLREAGGLIWFLPDVEVEYRPRSSFSALARQFFRTGQWRREVMKQNTHTASLRYLAPPTAVAGILLGTGAAAAGLILASLGYSWGQWLLLGLFAPAGYGVLVCVGGWIAGNGLPRRSRLLMPAVLSTMHLCWGSGFLFGKPST